jgi:predicted small secreted protein
MWKEENLVMKKGKLAIIAIVLAVITMGLAACNAADTAAHNIKQESDAFNVYRRVTAINNQTDNVIFTVEGFLSYTNEEDGDLSIVINTGENEYMRHVVHMNDRTTFFVEQLKASEFDAYAYKVRFYANYPDFEAGSEAQGA